MTTRGGCKEYRSLEDAVADLAQAKSRWEEARGPAAAGDILRVLVPLNRFAKTPECSDEVAERIYSLKHDLIGWLYNNGHCPSVRLVENEKTIPCRACGGSGRYMNPLTLQEVDCSLCGGSGTARRYDSLLSSEGRGARYYAVLIDFDGIRLVWHIRADRGRARGLTEKNPQGIQPHRLAKRQKP